MNTTKHRQHRLTRRQEQILTFIRASLRDRGYPPSIREIGLAVDLSSSSTVHSHLRAMETKGAIRRDPAKPRSIQLVDREPGRVELLEALVREARKWIVEGAWDVESGNQWVERAATLVPVEA